MTELAIDINPCLLCGKDAEDSDITIFQRSEGFPDVIEDGKHLGDVCERCGTHIKAVAEGIREAKEEALGPRS